MCGRYVSASPPDEIARYFSAAEPGVALDASYNVAPTNEVYVTKARDGHRVVDALRWGLVPFWAKDQNVGSRMINARSETAPDKPAFRRAFRKRRCLIPADGFYEWAKLPGQRTKQPYFIHRTDDELLAFAGLWERWMPKGEDGEDLPGASLLDTCTILTTSANETMAPIHDRMPVLLPPSRWDQWLDPANDDVERLRSLMVPAPDGVLGLRPIRTLVNRVANNDPELLRPSAEVQ